MTTNDFERAVSLANERDFAGALPHLKRFLAQPSSEDTAAALNLRGVCRHHTGGSQKQVLADYERAMQLGNVKARVNLAEHYCLREKDFVKALSYVGWFSTDDSEARFSYVKAIGISALLTGDLEFAIDQFSEVKTAEHKRRLEAELKTFGSSPMIKSALAALRGKKVVVPALADAWFAWRYSWSVKRSCSLESVSAGVMQILSRRESRLTDNVRNDSNVIIASPRLAAFLERRALKKVEFVPVIINDHAGEVASDQYKLVNPIGLQKCFDAKASAHAKRLVINPRKVTAGVELFRVAGCAETIVVHRELVRALENEKFTELNFEPLRRHVID